MPTLVRYLGAVECADQAVQIGRAHRTTASPCGMWCTVTDFSAWRAATRRRVVEVIAARQLSPHALATANQILAEVEATSDPAFYEVGAKTSRMAELYRFANCLTTITPGDPDVPVIPKQPETTPNVIRSLVLAAAMVAIVTIFLRARK
jgi:hypothetical protein